MTKVTLTDVPAILWILLGAVLATQSIWLFIDARRREKYPWFWGIWGAISFPLPILLYLAFVRKIFRRKRNHDL